MLKGPRDAVIAVTHRCNAHCVMCNIWKSTDADRLEPFDMRKLPPSLRTVNLSGGEPFLRNDLPEFVREVKNRCPKAVITLSTNAYLPQRIVDMMEQIRTIDPQIRLAVSLDAIGRRHDEIRGDGGVFERVVELVEKLQSLRFEGLRLSMTVSRANLDQILQVAQFASQRNLELGIVAAHSAQTHLKHETTDTETIDAPDWLGESFEKLISGWLGSWNPKKWARAHFAWKTYCYLAGNRWNFNCAAGKDFCFIQADGSVYSCSVCGKLMGNLKDENWEDIWQGTQAAHARAFSQTCSRNCWMICTARSVYRRRFAAVIAWMAAAKFLRMIGKFRLK